MNKLKKIFVFATGLILAFGTSSFAQTPIPASPVDAIAWLENEGNTVKKNELDQVIEIIIDYVPDVFVVGDLDIFPSLEVLHINYTGSFYDHHMSGIARLSNLKTYYIYRCEEVSEASLAVLRYLPKLETVKIVDCDSIYTLAALNSCSNLKHLTFSANSQFNFEELKRLTILENLESLELNDCRTLKDEHFEWLARARNLKRLAISECSLVTDIGLGKLSGLEQLNDLELRYVPLIKGKCFAALPTAIEKLYIYACKLDAESVTHFGRFKQLKYLRMGSAFETEASDWSALGDCKELTDLLLPRSQIADEHLQKMSGCRSLTKIDFEGCQKVSGKGLAALHGSTELRSLKVSGCRRIDSEDLPAISGFPNLAFLYMARTRTGSENVELLSRLKKLKTLDLDDCKRIDDRAVDSIANIKSLTTLNLRRVTRLTDESLRSLSRLKKMKNLFMSTNLKITGEGFAAFGPENELSRLVMDGFDALTPAGVGNLMRLTKLKSLELRCKNLSNEHVLALKGHPSLSSFGLDEMDNIDQKIYRRFYNSLPSYR